MANKMWEFCPAKWIKIITQNEVKRTTNLSRNTVKAVKVTVYKKIDEIEYQISLTVAACPAGQQEQHHVEQTKGHPYQSNEKLIQRQLGQC